MQCSVSIEMSREVVQAVTSVWTEEGDGARVRRSIGRPEVVNFNKLN